MVRPECGDTERIVRAMTNGHYDPVTRRVSARLFKGQNTSVSRLEILALPILLRIFQHQLERPPKEPGQPPTTVVAVGIIEIRALKDVGRAYSTPMELTVEVDRLCRNPAHAEIPQKVTEGLPKKINDKIEIYNLLEPRM